MVDIPLALASINSALAIAKTLIDTKTSLSQAELKLRIADLTSSLAETKIALAGLQDDIAAKDQEIARLKSTFARLEADTVVVKGYRYRKSDDGQAVGLPCCPRCLEVDGRIMLTERREGVRGAAFCPQCKTKYDYLPVRTGG